jgi:taurine dioxygenase
MTDIDIQPLQGAPLGARINGVDLAEPLDEDAVETLHRALLDFQVLVFPDQTIDDDQHAEFAMHWGKLQKHVLNQYVQEGRPEIFIITNLGKDGKPIGEHPDPGAAIWHTDGSWSGERGLVTILHAQRLPATGGDTLYANMYAAYEELDDEIKALIESAIAIHDLDASRQRTSARLQMTDEQKRAAPPVEWPVVRTHPESGRKCLYLGEHAARIKGMSFEDGRALIDRLNAHASQQKYVYRHVWQPNELVMWDNRALMHSATEFDWMNDVRILRRTTTVGERISPV